jgi:hypothetical protein
MENLVVYLAGGIDSRGGDACGYVSISDTAFKYAKRCGEWLDARPRFIEGAIAGDILLMHARYATCWKKDAESAHPYAIKRNGRVVLWGAHNGMIPNAGDIAKKNGRELTVDSKEIFECIADKNYDDLHQMNGYGVITWIDAAKPDHVKLARLSSNSDIHVVQLVEGGIVWGSTKNIVDAAVEAAGLTVEYPFEVDKIGTVYTICKDGFFFTENDQVHLKKYEAVTHNYTGYKQYSPFNHGYASGGADEEEYAEMYTRWHKDNDKDKDEIGSRYLTKGMS